MNALYPSRGSVKRTLRTSWVYLVPFEDCLCPGDRRVPVQHTPPMVRRPVYDSRIMTIGIGVLCSSHPRPHTPRPDSFVMVADTMGSTDTDSVDELHKMFVYEQPAVGITCAGNVAMAAEMVPLFKEMLDALPNRTHGKIWESRCEAVHVHRAAHFQQDVVLSRYAFHPQGQVPLPLLEKLTAEWQDYDTGMEVLVATLDNEGQALLYLVGPDYDVSGRKPGMVHIRQYPDIGP